MTDNPTPTTDDLVSLGAEKLAALLREKRKDEAGLRARLRETEDSRDKLSSSVLGFQREALRSHARDAGVVATALPDLERSLDLETVLNDEGLVDRDKVSTALDGIRTASPHYFTPATSKAGSDLSAGNAAGGAEQPVTWGDVLAP